ncbi:hypothetical protein Ccrd_001022, partial [Cynara cardunculus var. scolymus]
MMVICRIVRNWDWYKQGVNGIFLNFFGFNGTAGVWRIKTLEDCGGCLEKTIVDDMDIVVRAYLHGWKMTFLNDVEILEKDLAHSFLRLSLF